MPQKMRMPSSMRPMSERVGDRIVQRVAQQHRHEMSSATMPTKPAAIHSIASIRRSIQARFMGKRVLLTSFELRPRWSRALSRLRGRAGVGVLHNEQSQSGESTHTALCADLPPQAGEVD